ncbi:hypothetical protein ACSBR1_036084 [Camellia fascicularis]
MLFWRTKVGNNVVSLHSLGNGKLCKILSSANGKINCLSADVSTISTKWGQTESLTTDKENLYKVSVPPMTMVRVNLIATKASCDISFSYEQLDTTTLTDTQQITETMDDGIYTGSNCFNFKYETEQEML